MTRSLLALASVASLLGALATGCGDSQKTAYQTQPPAYQQPAAPAAAPPVERELEPAASPRMQVLQPKIRIEPEIKVKPDVRVVPPRPAEPPRELEPIE